MGIMSQGKEDVKTLFNAQGGVSFVGESGTELLFRLISAACLAPVSDGIVIGSTLEHPASRSACDRWARISGRDYVQATHNDETGTVSVEDYLACMDRNIAVATIVHTSLVTGMGVDIEAISRAIRQHSPDALIIIDGIQHASHGGIDVTAADVDGYVISPYKVFSRHGYGVAWVSDRLKSIAHDRLIGSPEDGWELGTRDTGSYATFSDVVDYFDWLGSQFVPDKGRRDRIEAAGQAIKAQEKSLTDAMLYGTGNLKGLSELPGVRIVGGIDNPAREGLVSMYVETMDSLEIVERLEQSGIRVHVRKADHYSGNVLTPLGLESCVRVSLCHYNSVAEVATFLAAMADITGPTP